ncbi:MAG TPA: carboxypeptidase-like regulatory domain-containing protein, partial [Cyclobacteriaceae bacterium]
MNRFIRLNCLATLTLLTLLIYHPVHSQTKIPDTKITVDVNGVALTQLLDIIQKKSGVSFSYNPNKISSDQKINYTAINKTLTAILNDMASQFALKYMLVENQIILKPEKKPEKKPTTQNITFSGNIKDKKSGEALIGATLIVKELQTGSVTNAFGYFSLTIPKGMYSVSCTF